MGSLGHWLKHVRASFLLLSFALVFLGSAVAVWDGSFYWWRSILALVGLTALHISVNVLNEYWDYQSGIDVQTDRTPYSGGSGMLVAGNIDPAASLLASRVCLGIGVAVGLVLTWVTNWKLIPLLIIGGFSIQFYNRFLSRHALGEVFAGLGLGLFPVLGVHFINTGYYAWSSFAAAVVAGILTFNLLLLNEFPDLAADWKGGRKNLLIVMGPVSAGRVYVATMAFMYVWIVATIVLGLMPYYCLAAISTIVIAVKPINWAWNHVGDASTMVQALGANVGTNLVTQALLGVGFLVSAFLG